MSRIVVDLSISLDGYVAGPDQSLDAPLGVGGEQLHEWAFAASAWQERHGHAGGEAGVDSDLIRSHVDAIGATVMGRRMYSSGEGPWADDPKARGWWGDEPPFHHPVFVVTHHARPPLPMQGGTTFTFVTDGIEAALEQARAAAGDKAVHVAGGAQVARGALEAGLVDELHLHVVPVLLGGGARLLDGMTGRLERLAVAASPTGVTHLRLRPVR